MLLLLRLVETRPQRGALTGLLLRTALLLLFAASSASWAATGAMDLTELSLQELMNVTIAEAPATPHGTRARTIAAIRAGCSDGADICDALRAILKSSASRNDADSGEGAGVTRAASNIERVNFSASADSVEYNVPHRDPGMYATPSDMGFGGVVTVVGATRALGLGSHDR